MKYLLDTHVLLWSIFESSKLTKKITGLLLDTQNDICASSISFWEISLKYGLGKLTLTDILPDQLPDIAEKSDIEIIHIDEKIASKFYKLKKYGHADPFDRMLVWQSIQQNLILISKDSELAAYRKEGLKTVW